MKVKIRLTITGSNPPNKIRQLIEPQQVEFEVDEDKVDAVAANLDKVVTGFMKSLSKTSGKLQALRDWLKK